MAHDPENMDIYRSAGEQKWVDPTCYGAGNNIPLGHIALRTESIDPNPIHKLDEEIILEAIMNCELRNQKWEA